MSFIAYYMEWTCALHQFNMAIEEVDGPFLSGFEILLKMIRYEATYCGKARHTVQANAYAFLAYWSLYVWY